MSPPAVKDPRLNPTIIDDELANHRDSQRYAIEYIRAHPARFIQMIPRRIWNLFYTDTTGLYTAFFAPPLNRPTILEPWRRDYRIASSITFRYYQLTMLLALVGMALANWRDPAVRLFGATILYLLFWTAMTFGQDRYRMPFMPVFCLFAGYAIHFVWRLLSSRNKGAGVTHRQPEHQPAFEAPSSL